MITLGAMFITEWGWPWNLCKAPARSEENIGPHNDHKRVGLWALSLLPFVISTCVQLGTEWTGIESVKRIMNGKKFKVSKESCCKFVSWCWKCLYHRVINLKFNYCIREFYIILILHLYSSIEVNFLFTHPPSRSYCLLGRVYSLEDSIYSLEHSIRLNLTIQ
jgi:hypothetical protein